MPSSTAIANLELRAQSRGFAQGLEEARKQYRTFAASIKAEDDKLDAAQERASKKRGKGGGSSFVYDSLSTAVGGLVSGAVSRGIGALEDIGKQAYNFNDQLVRLGITADATPRQVDLFAGSIRAASDATGISQASILEAGQSFVALTGDMGMAQDQLLGWARVAQATNSSITDISAGAAALIQQLKIDPSQIEKAMSILAIQGKKGAVELKDLAGGLSQIAPQWAQFANGKGVKGVTEMGAALQIVRRGFGSGDETVTGLQSLLTALAKKSDKLGIGGMVTKGADGKKQFKDVLELVTAIGHKFDNADPSKVIEAFGRVEAYRAFLQLRDNVEETNKLIAASEQAGDVQKDLGTYLNSTAGKTALAWEQAKNRILAAFTPERLEAFAGALIKAIDAAAKLVDYIAKIAKFIEDNSPDNVKKQIVQGTKDMDPEKQRELGTNMMVAGESIKPGWFMSAISSVAGGGGAAQLLDEMGTAYSEAGSDIYQRGSGQIRNKIDSDRRAKEAAGNHGTFGWTNNMGEGAWFRDDSQDAVVPGLNSPRDKQDMINAIRDGLQGIAIYLDGTEIGTKVENAKTAQRKVSR